MGAHVSTESRGLIITAHYYRYESTYTTRRQFCSAVRLVSLSEFIYLPLWAWQSFCVDNAGLVAR